MYELIIRLQDPAFDKVIKKIIVLPKKDAQAIWHQAKTDKQPVEFAYDGIDYMVSPSDVLQVRQKLGNGQSGSKDSDGYRQTVIGTHKILIDENDEHKTHKNYYVFELCRTKKIKGGWLDSEYRELHRMEEQEYRDSSDEKIQNIFAKLKLQYLK